MGDAIIPDPRGDPMPQCLLVGTDAFEAEQDGRHFFGQR
jgi:hypothetical protein